jgi:hypothetical protein
MIGTGIEAAAKRRMSSAPAAPAAAPAAASRVPTSVSAF